MNVFKEVELCSYAENKSQYGNFKNRNLKFNLALREAEKSLNSSFNNQTNISNSSGTSFIPLTDSSTSFSDLISVTSTPFNTTTKPDVGNESVTVSYHAWQNGNIPSNFRQWLAHRWVYKITNKTQISLMASVVSQANKCLNDFSELLDVAVLKTKSHILIPVNDSPAVDMPGGSGSHWSLLLYLYVSESNEFLHSDSLGCANQSHALKIS